MSQKLIKKADKRAKNVGTKVFTPAFRVSFPAVFEPTAMSDKDTPKYAVTMLFPKDTDISMLKDAVDEAIAEGMDKKWNGKKPKSLRLPFRDGDEDENYSEKEGFPGHIFVRASSIQPVGLVDKHKTPIEDPMDFYAGCYAIATLVAYPYDTAGNRGIAFGLQNIQKIADGEHFSGRKRASDDFEDWDDEDLESEDDDWDEE